MIRWIQQKVDSGYGFVRVAEFGPRPFFVVTTAIRDGNVLTAGTEIEFTAVKEINRKTGEPVMSNGRVRWRCAMVTGGADMAYEYSNGHVFQKTHTPDLFDDKNQLSGEVVVWFADKGYGFIKPKRGNVKIFAHVSEILDGNSLALNSTVKFAPKWDHLKEKWCAIAVFGGSPEGKPWVTHTLVEPHEDFRLFVRGLSLETEAEDLREAFCDYGAVNCVVVKTHDAEPRTRGIGFVSFNTKEEIDRAVEEMDYASIDSCLVRCSRALPRGQKRVWTADSGNAR